MWQTNLSMQFMAYNGKQRILHMCVCVCVTLHHIRIWSELAWPFLSIPSIVQFEYSNLFVVFVLIKLESIIVPFNANNKGNVTCFDIVSQWN